MSEILDKIYKAITYNVDQPKFIGISNDAHITIPFQPPLITNNDTFTISIQNLSFLNSMPNIKTGVNDTIKHGSNIIKIDQGRYSFQSIFESMPTGLSFEISTLTGKITMNNDETVTSTTLLKDNFGFTQASYAPGEHVAEGVPSIESFSRVILTCDEIAAETATSFAGNIQNVHNFSIARDDNYQAIILNQTVPMNSTLIRTDRIDYLHFHLIDEKNNPLFFGEHSSEFQLTGTISRH